MLAVEDNINKTLKRLVDNGEIEENLYKKLKCTGSQPARLYGLAKVHKKDIPLRPVLSLPGSAYDKLNKWLSTFFEKIPGANIETSTERMKDTLNKTTLEPNETLFSMDVKSLYTNVPVTEAIDLACDALYATELPPELNRSTFRKLMELAVTNVWFLCDSEWYIQKDGVAMGASLAVILANLWMKKFEPKIATEHPTPAPVILETVTPNEVPYPCGKCKENVTRRGYSIKCNTCLTWYHRKCTDLSVLEIKQRNSDSSIWYCGCNTAPPELTLAEETKAKVFGRYVDDILRSAETDEIDQILATSNSLHGNLEFTIERLDDSGEMPFLDMRVHLKDGKIQTSWYQKPTDTGLTLHYRALAPTTYKRNIVEGSIHRIFNATTSWRNFDEGLQKVTKILENNQYPPQFYQPIVRKTLEKIINGKPATMSVNSMSTVKKDYGAVIIMQYRGTKSDKFAKKLKRACNATVIFTTRKMKTALPSLKSPIPKLLLSNVVYQITCPGCQSSYVGQTTRHLTTRIQEHSRVGEHLKTPSHVGEHLKNCNATMDDAEIKVIDRTTNAAKLLTLEALHISRRAPSINQKEEYRGRELTLRL